MKAQSPSRAVFLLLLWVSITISGCQSNAMDSSPEQVLTQFLEAMARSMHDSNALQEAYNRLDQAAQKKLSERARKAETLAGHDFQPWEMLAAGRFRLRFAPKQHDGIHAEIDGNKAILHVVGGEKGERVKVPMVREAGRWRVKLEIR